MTNWFFFLSTLAVVSCRPQINPQETPSVDKWEEHKPKITLIPFYGGGLGQSLQVVEMPDGTVFTSIIKTPPKKHHASTEEPEVTELENPPLPSKQDIDFGSNLKNIHETAINIIKLQEIAKKNGQLSAEQEETYQKNIEELNTSARNLAELQQQEDEFSENREGLTEWFERKKSTKKDKDKKKKEEEDKKKEEEDKKRKEEEKEEEEETDEENEETDGIAIGLPPPDASVAEAKPVGLAVAGEGGVAASKPIATAVVGPGGLAIARPVGTAIAGVAPDQALVPIYAEGYVGGTKPKRYNSSNKGDATSEFLNKIISKYHQV